MRTPIITALTIVLLSGTALGSSVIGMRNFDDGALLTLNACTTQNYDGAHIVVTGKVDPPLVLKDVKIQTRPTPKANQKADALVTRKTCTTTLCIFDWPRTSMAAGSNDIAVLLTTTINTSYLTTATLGQPKQVVVPPGTDSTCYVPTPPPPTNYCLDANGGILTTDSGERLTCD